MNRRAFLENLAATSATAVFITAVDAADSAGIPSYLEEYEQLYRKDPHAAALEWFRNAKFGFFICYGLYSQLVSVRFC